MYLQGIALTGAFTSKTNVRILLRPPISYLSILLACTFFLYDRELRSLWANVSQ